MNENFCYGLLLYIFRRRVVYLYRKYAYYIEIYLYGYVGIYVNNFTFVPSMRAKRLPVILSQLFVLIFIYVGSKIVGVGWGMDDVTFHFVKNDIFVRFEVILYSRREMMNENWVLMGIMKLNLLYLEWCQVPTYRLILDYPYYRIS